MAYKTFQKVDENDDVEMYHFKYDDDIYLDLKVKGLVVDKVSQEVVCATSMHTDEYDLTMIDTIPDIFSIDWSQTTVLYSEEGCFLRVYHYNNEWYISTHRKLNADNSKWGSKYSFKTLFVHALTELLYNENDQRLFNLDVDFFNKLDKNYVYTFLLRNNSCNRIVCDSPGRNEFKVYFSGVYPIGDKHDYIPKFIKLNVNIPSVKVLQCENLDDLKNCVSQMNYKYVQGVIVFAKMDGMTRIFKVMCDGYLNMKDVRNNCSNLVYRYAQIRVDFEMREKLLKLFPQFSYDFIRFENTLLKIAQYISNQYINRFVKKQYAMVTPLQYKITKKIREWYLGNPFENRVTTNVVAKFINDEQPDYIYKLVTEFDEAN